MGLEWLHCTGVVIDGSVAQVSEQIRQEETNWIDCSGKNNLDGVILRVHPISAASLTFIDEFFLRCVHFYNSGGGVLSDIMNV